MVDKYLIIVTIVGATALAVCLLLFAFWFVIFIKKDWLDGFRFQKRAHKELSKRIECWEDRVVELEKKNDIPKKYGESLVYRDKPERFG